MHDNHNLFLFLIEINNMHRTKHILPISRTCIWRRCGVSWHRYLGASADGGKISNRSGIIVQVTS